MSIVVKYYCGDTEETVAAADAKTHREAGGYVLWGTGLYRAVDAVWPLDKEGLYRFYDGDRLIRQHCCCKEDGFALVSSLLRCCDFSGEALDVANQSMLNKRMVLGDERNLPPGQLLCSMFADTLAAYRQVSLYSPVAGGPVFEWLEVWSEKIQSWELYWPERGGYLGRVGAGRTCFDVFAEFVDGRAAVTDIAPFKDISDEFLAGAGILPEVNRVLRDVSGFPRLAEDLRLVPLLRDEGRLVVRAACCEQYAGLLAGRTEELRLAPDDSGLLFQARVFTDEYIRDVIYGPQLYILSYRAVRVDGRVDKL